MSKSTSLLERLGIKSQLSDEERLKKATKRYGTLGKPTTKGRSRSGESARHVRTLRREENKSLPKSEHKTTNLKKIRREARRIG